MAIAGLHEIQKALYLLWPPQQPRVNLTWQIYTDGVVRATVSVFVQATSLINACRQEGLL